MANNSEIINFRFAGSSSGTFPYHLALFRKFRVIGLMESVKYLAGAIGGWILITFHEK